MFSVIAGVPFAYCLSLSHFHYLDMTEILLKRTKKMKSSIHSAVLQIGAPVAHWVKRWPTDLADRVRSSLEVKSSQPYTEFHCTQPFIFIQTSS